METLIGIILVLFVLPLIIVLHYVTKWKSTRGLSGADETLLEELWETAQKMESRVNALETILDDDVPGWRQRT